jgi:hypothetical protein
MVQDGHGGQGLVITGQDCLDDEVTEDTCCKGNLFSRLLWAGRLELFCGVSGSAETQTAAVPVQPRKLVER